MKSIVENSKKMLDRPLWVVLARGISILIGLAISILIVRGLGVQTRGDLGAVLGLMFGLPLLMSAGSHYYVRQAFALRQELMVLKSIRRMILILVPINFLISVLISSVFFTDLTNSQKILLICGCTTSSPVIMILGIQSIMIMRQNYIFVGMSLLLPSAFTLFLTILSNFFGKLSFESVVGANILSTLLMFLFSYSQIKIPHNTEKLKITELIQKSKSSGVGMILDFNNNKLDEVLIYNFFGGLVGGLYSIAVTFVRSPLVIGYGFSTKYSGRFVNQIKEHSRVVLIEAMRVTIFWGMISSIFLAIAGPRLIEIFFGKEALGAGTLLIHLSIASVCMIVSVLLTGYSISIGNSKAFAKASVLGLCCFCLVLIVLKVQDLPDLSYLATNLSAIVTLLVLWKSLNVQFRDCIPRINDASRYLTALMKTNQDEVKNE
jgi:O-antigen/teichoic acid export membrane protein